MERPRFLNVIPDETALDAKRVLLCTGKIGQELRMERSKLKMSGPAIVSLEQIYPFPETEVQALLGMLQERQRIHLGAGRAGQHGRAVVCDAAAEEVLGSKVRSIKRAANSTPATGSAKAHELEQKTLITLALGKGE